MIDQVALHYLYLIILINFNHTIVFKYSLKYKQYKKAIKDFLLDLSTIITLIDKFPLKNNIKERN